MLFMDQNRRNILVRCLTTVLGQEYEVLPLLDLRELNGGQPLVNKDDPADAVYFVVSDRQRVLLCRIVEISIKLNNLEFLFKKMIRVTITKHLLSW